MTLTPNLIACLAIGGAGILTALLSIPFFRGSFVDENL